MANRVYIYTSNNIPNRNTNTSKLKGIYEYNYNPGIAGILLCGNNYKQQAPSPIWPQTTSSVSMLDLEFMNKFLDYIERMCQDSSARNVLPDLKDIRPGDVQSAKRILDKNKGKFVITDFSELSDMDEDTLEGIKRSNAMYAKMAVKSCLNYKKTLEGGMFSSKDPYERFVKEMKKFRMDSGILGFSDVLYYG